jgi:hypothetical protein
MKGHTHYSKNGFTLKNGNGSITGRAILVVMSMDDNIYTFIFGNAFGGTVRPCCELFEPCGSASIVSDFCLAAFFAGVALGS